MDRERFIYRKRLNLPWLLSMAWRDSRRNRSRLLLFISSIILGIAALVATFSFGYNLQQDIDKQAKTLVGADLRLKAIKLQDHVLDNYWIRWEIEDRRNEVSHQWFISQKVEDQIGADSCIKGRLSLLWIVGNKSRKGWS